MRLRFVLFAVGLLFAAAPSVVLTYLLMPFPGSQGLDSMNLAWNLHRVRNASLVAGSVLAIIGLALCLSADRSRRTWFLVVVPLAAVVALVVAARRYTADRLFQPPASPRFAAKSSFPAADTQIMGVVVGEKARAYPIRLLAYHHVMVDDIAGVTLLPTY